MELELRAFSMLVGFDRRSGSGSHTCRNKGEWILRVEPQNSDNYGDGYFTRSDKNIYILKMNVSTAEIQDAVKVSMSDYQ
jgi:hypothetical protein